MDTYGKILLGIIFTIGFSSIVYVLSNVYNKKNDANAVVENSKQNTVNKTPDKYQGTIKITVTRPTDLEDNNVDSDVLAYKYIEQFEEQLKKKPSANKQYDLFVKNEGFNNKINQIINNKYLEAGWDDVDVVPFYSNKSNREEIRLILYRYY